MKIRKLFTISLIIFFLWGCTKKAKIEQMELKVYSGGEVLSYSLTNDYKIEEVLGTLNKCTDKKNFKKGREKFDLPKSITYEIILNEDVYMFVGEYVVYDSFVYVIDDYENVISKIKYLFIV